MLRLRWVLPAIFLSLLLACSLSFAEKRVPFELPKSKALRKVRSALLKTEKGDIYLRLFPDRAPWHVANFKFLAEQGFYEGKIFHLILDGYIAQGGTPPGNPNYTPRYSLPPEFNDKIHKRGSLGMARLPDDLNPERRSHASQFHIVMKESPHLDGNYSVFGEVVEGMDVVERLEKGDEILSLEVYVRR